MEMNITFDTKLRCSLCHNSCILDVTQDLKAFIPEHGYMTPSDILHALRGL